MSVSDILQNLSDLLVTDNVFKDLLRELGWGIVMFLKKLVDIIDTVVHNTYKVINFVSSSIVESNIGVLSGIMVAILAISIAILGYKLIFKRDNKSNAFTGALLVIVVVMALPIIFSQGVKIVSSLTGSVSISTNTGEGLLSDRVIKSNLHDLMKYAEYDNFKLPSNVTTYNDIPPSVLKHIDMSEVLVNSKIPDKNRGVVNRELDFDKNGKIVDKDFNKTMLTGRDGYYRYYVNWFSIIANFIIVGITLLLMGVKTVKIVFNLALDRIVGTILIFTDIEEGKRAKELLTHIIATFAVLMVSVFSMNLYAEFTGWIQTQQLGTGWVGAITNLVILLGTSIALLEGPTIIQKLLGTQVDSGLARTAVGIAGGYKIGKGIVGAGKTTGKVAGGAIKTGVAAAKYGKGLSDKSGLTDSIKNGANKMATDAYEQAAKKHGFSNSDNSDSNASDETSDIEKSINSGTSNQTAKEDSNQGKNVELPQYSGIEQDMKESGYNKDNNNVSESGKENGSVDKNSSDKLNTYKSNVPGDVEFNEALNTHSEKTSSKRTDLNTNRRKQRTEGINTNEKLYLSSKKNNEVIPRNFTKNGGEK